MPDNGYATVTGYTPEWLDFASGNPSARLVVVKTQTPANLEIYSGYMQGWAGASGATIDFSQISLVVYR